MAKQVDGVQPSELENGRDHGPEREQWTSRATTTLGLATIAIVIVVLAALIGDRVPLGPGRPLAVVLVTVWAVAATFVAVQRPNEVLGVLIAVAALVGAVALFGAALAGREMATATVRDFGSGLRAVALALLPAVGLHLALVLPDGTVVGRARRCWVLGGYVASTVLAIVLLEQRPDVDATPIVVLAVVDTIVALVGYAARYRTVQRVEDRARLQWPAWGVVSTGFVCLGAWVLQELLSWPEELRSVVLVSTALVPVSLALSASRLRVGIHHPR